MSVWTRSREMALQTPEHRNRYVDFLRAGSIMVVVFGHWLMAGAYFGADGLEVFNLLTENQRVHYVTWLLQVMPIFFLVGGYANAAGLRAARRRQEPYSAWLRARLRRLLLPVVPLLIVWSFGAAVLLDRGIDVDLVRLGSQAALVPVWFLATYVAIVALAPLTLAAWERWGWASIAFTAAIAGLIDLVSLGLGWTYVGYLNYLFVWGTIHSLGYAWGDGRIGPTASRIGLAVAGLVATATLVSFGPYPVAMVGLDTAAVTNSQPPKVTLVALGLFQAGLLLAFEERARRFLARERNWAATILVNGRIMTLYLWHLTAMVGLIGLLAVLGGPGLGIVVDTPSWWLTRPLWFLALVLVTVPFVAVFGRYERPHTDRRPHPAPWRPVLAVVCACAGLGLLARFGIADEDGLNGVALTLPLAGLIAGGVGGARWWERRRPR
ncbi:MAG TPA: acyltransferase [Acidimicrobiia bacterium]|nr:acyltransferase [Acidimicrobiia bacterium]